MYIPRNIISEECINEILLLSKKFSSSISNNFIFEQQINTDTSIADFSFNIIHQKNNYSGYIDNISSQLLNDKYWSGFIKLSKIWDKHYIDRINHFWIEFDKKVFRKKLPLPLFFFDINDKLGSDLQSFSDYKWILDVIKLLSYKDVNTYIACNLQNVFKNLSEDEKVTDIGFMPSRDPDIIRVCIKLYNKNNFLNILDKLNLSNEKKKIESIIKPYYSYIDSILLHINIKENISKRIGIDLNINNRLLLNAQARWKNVIELLHINYLCTGRKKSFLLEWSGVSREIADKILFNYEIRKYISCFKFVFQPDQSLLSKVYFGFVLNKY